jgi:hypothetical protein
MPPYVLSQHSTYNTVITLPLPLKTYMTIFCFMENFIHSNRQIIPYTEFIMKGLQRAVLLITHVAHCGALDYLTNRSVSPYKLFLSLYLSTWGSQQIYLGWNMSHIFRRHTFCTFPILNELSSVTPGECYASVLSQVTTVPFPIQKFLDWVIMKYMQQ